MLKNGILKGLYLIIFVLITLLAKAQVTVQINSGNPNFPFPQFLSYDFDGTHSLGNLGTQNAPGLVHAEMEKIIREAWQIEANRYTLTGESWAGVQYIKSNVNCPYDCSEGVGYGLIAAAYMADKATFDGIWMREHDIRRALQVSYRTGDTIRPGYMYGDNTITEPGGDAATDGDVDIALGLLMAWKQWGDNSGYIAFNGTPISYKKEALDVIRGLVERKNRGFMSGSVKDCRSVSGNVGFDGYLKNGNTGPGETTTFGSGDPLWCPEFGGPNKLHIDYAAPSYFYSFRDVMTTEGFDPWEINQMHRAEASSDWIMGKILDNPRGVPHAGWADVQGSTVKFSSYDLGEDFRAAWRTILNYVWHGDPDYTWDPVTHTVQSGISNSYEQLVAKRFSGFVEDERKTPWANPCHDFGGGPNLTYYGAPGTNAWYDSMGVRKYTLPINYGMATSTPSIVAAQNYDLMGDMFTQCAIVWDVDDAGDRYLTSKPRYFHGFFRLLGMLILTGNFQDPLVAEKIANLKIYRDVDKTFGFTGDEFEFTLSYRNYGKLPATGVKIVETLPADFTYVAGSASDAGVYNAGTHSITWTITGGVPGFISNNGVAPTQGIRTYKLKASPSADGNYCASATITATNSKSWTTNEYPNNVTEVMERNCIDIVKRALLIDKSVNYSKVQDNTEVLFKINFENSSTAGWINGGRPNVFWSYAQSNDNAAMDQTRGILIRAFHGAAEPYINYQNYRVSLFLNDNSYTCIKGVGGCTVGWTLNNTIYEGGGGPAGITFSQELFTPGQDARGKWNQRVIIQFADQLATTTPHLSAQNGNALRIHRGALVPLRAVWDLTTSTNAATDWSDDWSWDASAKDADDGNYYPVTNDWTDPHKLNLPVKSWHKHACELATKKVDNVLIEEWDGYTWRRAYGNGPIPGRDIEKVVIRDTLPPGLKFSGWVKQNALGIDATYDVNTNIITWTIPKMQVGQKDSLQYKAIAKFTTTGVCPKADQTHINPAWIEGLNESKKRDTASVTVTCDPVTLPPVPTTMTKTADKTAYIVGDSITYTIQYKQTHGAILDPSLSTASEWNQYNGTWNFGTALSNATTHASPLILHKKAHGTNGTITGTLQLADYENFSIVLRQSGTTTATGSYVTFKSNPGPGTIDISVWNGNTSLIAKSFGYPGTPQNFKIVLNGNQLNLWVGNLTGSPLLTVTGLTVQSGYIGFLNGTPDAQGLNSSHKVIALHTELDSAYDIIISDPIPAEITFGAPATGVTHAAGIVYWPTMTGPVPYGTVITKTWKGAVTTCSSTGKIVNNAYANMLGQQVNSIGAQSVVSCTGTVPTCTPPTAVTVSTAKTALCKGAVLTVSGKAIPASADYYYTWYHNGSAVTAKSKTYADYKKPLTTVADSGTYTLRVEDGITGSVSCYSEKSLHIRIDTSAVAGTITASQELCLGTPASPLTGTSGTGGIAIKNYKWQRSTVSATGPWADIATFSTTATGLVIGTPTKTIYYRRIDSSGVCANVPTNVDTIRVNNSVKTDSIVPLENDTLCISAGSVFQLKGIVDSTARASVNGGYYFTWKHYRNGALQETRGPVKYESFPVTARAAVEADSGTYYLIVQDGLGAKVCMDTLKINIVVRKNCVILPPSCKKPVSVTSKTASGKDTLCAGNSLHLALDVIDTLPSPQHGYYFSWRRVNVQGNTLLYGPSPTYADLKIPSVTAADSGSYYLIVQDGIAAAAACTTSAAAINMVIHTPVTSPAVITASDTICTGTKPGLFTEASPAAGSNGLPYRYQWYTSTDSFKTVAATSMLTGENQKVYQAVALTSTTYFVRMDSVGVCPKVPANILTIQVDALPLAGTVGKDTIICSGSMIKAFSELTAATGGSGTFTYQWQQSPDNSLFTDIAGATINIYQPGALSDTTYFRRIDSSGACAADRSNVIKVSVITGADAGTIASANPTICYGTAPIDPINSVTVASGGSGSAGTESYQWQQSADNITWVDITGKTTVDYTENNPLTDTTYYRRRVIMGSATCDTAYTLPVAINVFAPLNVGSLPADTTICSGKNILINPVTQSSGGTAPNGLTFQWIQSEDKGLNWSPADNTNDQVNYTAPVLTDSIWYAQIVTAGSCKTDTTNSMHVHVDSVNMVSVHLSDTLICAGKDVTFIPAYLGGGASPVYEWYTTTDPVHGWLPVSGADKPYYTVTNVQAADSGTYYKAVVKSSFTCNSGAAESIARLGVNDIITPKVSIASSQSGPLCDTVKSITFTAIPIQGTGTLTTYQWYNGVTHSPIPLATDQAYTPATAPVNGEKVYVIMTTDLSCATPKTAASDTVTLDIHPMPKPVIINGADTTVCMPFQVILKTTGLSGGNLQWYKNDSIAIPNATGATYTVPTSDYPGATFTVVEDNGTCSAASDTAKVSMLDSPSANAGSDIYAVEGETIFLNGSVSSNTVNYVWIPGSTLSNASSLQPSLKVPASNVLYTLVAYNHGNVCSASDEVTIYIEKQIKIPNVITVNGDGVNDTWDIENIENFPDAEFLIYNRWGNLVWKSSGYPKQWDATNYRNGEVLPDGTYFYIIDLHTERVKETFTGYIQVVK